MRSCARLRPGRTTVSVNKGRRRAGRVPLRTHWLRLRATAHPTEDLERVRDAVCTVAGLDPERFQEAITQVRIATHHGADLHLVETELTRSREVRDALEHLLTDEVRATLLREEELDRRVGEEGVLYLRFDKQRAVQGGLRLGGEDAVQVRLKVQTHPTSRDAAKRILVDALQAQRL